MNDLVDLARRHLGLWETGWSMGAFGAVAEFHQDDGETALVDDPARLARATARGGIRLDPERLAAARAVAYETLSPKRHRWSQAVALCLPTGLARGSARDGLTELGPDGDCLREEDRGSILFDLGLSLSQCDFCIRTGDPALLQVLRAHLGRSVFDSANPVMHAVLAAHPHRIATTVLGRVEVYQKIGGPDTGGVSPPGPHTHLLPKLMRAGRTHSANVPIPDGLVPLASLHPGNPVIGALGEDRPFDFRLHAGFQALLGLYGIPGLNAAKRAARSAVEEDAEPSSFPVPSGRFPRAAFRLALRQYRREAETRNDAVLGARLDGWLAFHDGGGELEDDDRPGH